jgi:hypothetical protein
LAARLEAGGSAALAAATPAASAVIAAEPIGSVCFADARAARACDAGATCTTGRACEVAPAFL